MDPQLFWEGGLIPQCSLKNEGWAQQNDWDVASMLNMVWGYGLSSLGGNFLLFFLDTKCITFISPLFTHSCQ